MVTRKGPINSEAEGPLSPLVGSLGLALSIQERDVDRHSSSSIAQLVLALTR